MSNIYEVFNVKSDLQLNSILNKLDLNAYDMINLNDIVDSSYSLSKKREKIMELMSSISDENYIICENLFNSNKRIIKESEMVSSSTLNMNQAIQLNKLFELASKKFQEVDCSQAFYSMLSQKLSKNFANAFFNTLKSCDESSELKYNPELTIDGKNFADTIFPLVNELTNYLNSCKSESKKEEVNENYMVGNKVQGKNNQGTYIIDSIKDGFYNLRNIYDQNRNRLYPVSKKTLDEEFKLLNESIETQPDMFGGPDTYYKDGIEALDFDNVLDAMKKVAPEMDFVDDRNVKGKYSMIFQPKSSGLELNQKGLKKIKDYLSQRFGKENIAVRLAQSQYAPEIKKLYITFINQIDVQNELNESLQDTLSNFKYYISTSNSKDELEYIKSQIQILFGGSNSTEDRNQLSELLSMINTKLSSIKPTIQECCDIDSLLEPFKTTVVNITVNDDGCIQDCEKEMASNSLKALASHINDTKDCCEENNIERMETIISLLNSLARYFHKRICETMNEFPSLDQLNESNDEYRKYCGFLDLNKNTLMYLPKNIHHSMIRNEEDVFNGIVRFGVTMYKNSLICYICSDSREHVMKSIKILDKELSNLPIDYYMVEYFEDGKRIRMNIDKFGRTIYENVNDWFPSWDNMKNKVIKENQLNEAPLMNKIKRGVAKTADNIHNAGIKVKQKLGMIGDDESLRNYFIEYLIRVYMAVFDKGQNPHSNPIEMVQQFGDNLVRADSKFKKIHDMVLQRIDDWCSTNIGRNAAMNAIKNQLAHIGVPDEYINKAWEEFKKDPDLTDWSKEIRESLKIAGVELNESSNEVIYDPYEEAVESVNAQIDDFGSYDDEYIRSCCEDVAKAEGLDVKKLYYYVTNRKWSVWDKDEDYEELDESYDEKYNDIREELNDIKQDYLNNELDVYDATNAVDNLIGNKSEAEAIVDSWDDPAKHGLYGITDDKELDEDTVFDHSWYEVKGQKYPKRTKNGVEIKEMCSSGATCAGAVASIPSPAKPKSPKRKHKKSKVDEMMMNMFKKQIIEGINGQLDSDGNHYEYKDGYFYINGNIAKTTSKYEILESLDNMIELETLNGFNSEEMKLLEEIEASNDVGNEQDNQENNTDNSNEQNAQNNQQTLQNANVSQDNLGDVNQNVTQDNDLTPVQRQLKKDTQKALDTSMNSGLEPNVSLNNGMDNNNDQQNNTQTNLKSDVKYKLIGKDDSDSNNVKYIIQDPTTKETQIVDATKLRLEK